MTIQFANPAVLFMVWVVPAVAVGWFMLGRRRERHLEAFVSRHMQQKLRPAWSGARTTWQTALVATGLVLGFLIL